MKLFSKLKEISYEKRTEIVAIFSLLVNVVLSIVKIVLGFFLDKFFIAAGIVNIFMLLAGLECILGIYKNNISRELRNIFVSTFVLLAGIVYMVYSARLLFFDIKQYRYPLVIGVFIGLLAIFEFVFSIRGLKKVKGCGRFYRNLKLINFIGGCTATVLALIVILPVISDGSKELVSIVGIMVGILTIIISFVIYIAPRVSYLDKDPCIYKLVDEKKNTVININRENNMLCVVESKWYGNYNYKGLYRQGFISGNIVKGRPHILIESIPTMAALVLLAPIWILVYIFGALFYAIKNTRLTTKLDKIMLENGFVRINKEDLNVDFDDEA